MLVAALVLAGCGEGSTPAPLPSTTAATPPPASSAQVSQPGSGAVASVAGVPISESSYEHWLTIETAGHAPGSPRARALGFLITQEWILGEAAARHSRVTEPEVKAHLARVEHRSFPKPGALERFETQTGETAEDLHAIATVELLEAKIAAKLTAGQAPARATATLTTFEKAFQNHWRHYTTCKPKYVMEDCSEYRHP